MSGDGAFIIDAEHHIRAAVERISPSSRQRSIATRSHNWLRTLFSRPDYANKLHGTAFSGSYSRGTAVAAGDCVEIMLFLNPHYWGSQPCINHVLGDIGGIIASRYPSDMTITTQGRVVFPFKGLMVHAWPALMDTGDGERILIPCMESTQWRPADPHGFACYINRVNRSSGQFAKALIKLVKHWNYQLPSETRLESSMVEAMVGSFCENTRIASLFSGLIAFFDCLADTADENKNDRPRRDFSIGMLSWPERLIDPVSFRELLRGIGADRMRSLMSEALATRDALLQADGKTQKSETWSGIDDALRL